MNKNKGLLLIFSTAFISGLSIFINKFGVSVVNPYIFTGLKNIIVAFLAFGWLLALCDRRIFKNLNKTKWLFLVLVGLIGGSAPFLLFFKGLSLTTAARGSFIHKSMFIYIAILAVVFLKEKVSRKFLSVGLLLFLGNVFLLGLVFHDFGWGDFFIFLATLLWAGENVLSKYLLREIHPRILIWARMFFGSGFILLFWTLTGQADLVFSLNLAQIGWVMITSILLFGYVVTWYTGLKYVKVSVAAIILLLASPITTLLTFVFLDRTLVFNQIIGMFLSAVALWVMCWQYYYGQKKSIQSV